jgi:hypothetical protein
MNEPERHRAIEALQLEMFSRKRELEREIEQLELDFKAKLELVKSQGTKVCRKCGEERSIQMFYVDIRYKDDHFPYCKLCKSAMSNARNKAA